MPEFGMDDIVGETIIDIKSMSTEEANRMGWDTEDTFTGVIILSNGLRLHASLDAEGDGPGVLFVMKPDGNSFPLFF